jgi:hypothetical protein
MRLEKKKERPYLEKNLRKNRSGGVAPPDLSSSLRTTKEKKI